MTAAETALGLPVLRVLVIDDNRDLADTLSQLLSMDGFAVRTAYDGEEGLEAARAFRPECILSDIGLPGIDGYRLAEMVRRQQSLTGVTLIAVTACADRARAKAAGY